MKIDDSTLKLVDVLGFIVASVSLIAIYYPPTELLSVLGLIVGIWMGTYASTYSVAWRHGYEWCKTEELNSENEEPATEGHR